MITTTGSADGTRVRARAAVPAGSTDGTRVRARAAVPPVARFQATYRSAPLRRLPADAGVPAVRRRRPSAADAVVAVAAGVLLISVAYAAGRASAPGAQVLFWAGQALLFLPVALLVVARSTRPAARVGALVAFAVGQYVAKWCYSPLGFKFPDEWQHWRTATDIIETHRLLTPNPGLPISPRYPGLELVTAAVHATTGLGVFPAGLLVAGVAHVLLTVAVLLLLRTVTGSWRAASVGGLLYSCNPHSAFFNSYFLYEALALPLMVLAVYLTVRSRAVRRWALTAVACGLGAATVVTHHVTAVVLVGLALVLAGGAWQGRDRGTALRLLVLAVATLGTFAVWTAFVATDTWSYLSNPFTDLARSMLGQGGASVPLVENRQPVAERVVSVAYGLLPALLLPPATVLLWRRRRDWRARTAMVASAGYFGLLAVRAFSTDGAELTGRALTFVTLATAAVLAMWAVRVWRRSGRATVAVLLVGVVWMVGGIVAGWPPFWERIPGRYHVAGFESAVEPESLTAAAWTLRHLGPHNRIAADTSNGALLGTLGGQDPVGSLSEVYYRPTVTADDVAAVRREDAAYLLVDRRLSTQVPIHGSYFPNDSRADRHGEPVPPAALDKFARMPDLSRVYDSGSIVIYHVKGLRDVG